MPPRSRRRRTARWLVAIAAGTLCLAVLALFLFAAISGERIVWLTPKQLAQSTQGGPLSKLKGKLVNITPMFVWRIWPTKPSVRVDASLMTMTEQAVRQLNLGTPAASNAAGLRAWILSPDELAALQARLKASSNVTLLSRPRVLTRSGTAAGLSAGTISQTSKSTPMPVGLSLEVMPKVAAKSIKLTVGVSATEAVPSIQTNLFVVRTNFATACRVFVPSTGALVMDGGSANQPGSTNYLIIISPTAVDARGNPIKQ